MREAFEYEKAFARNLGLVSEGEQAKLRALRVGLPGLGGVGGAHLQVLARLGIGAFHLADPDHFEVANFNRQFGATLETVGAGKAKVSQDVLASINPEAEVRRFDDGICAENIGAFLDGVDLVVDGIEYFCIDARRMLCREARARGIPVLNCGPIGYGAAVIVFTADTPSFEEHFRIQPGMTRVQQLLAFGLGLGPGLAGDVDPKYVSFAREKGPALALACSLCAAAAGAEVLKLVTGRGRVALAPEGRYIDLLRGETSALRPPPDLLGPMGDGVLAGCFARFPELRELHEGERAQAETCVAAGARA